MFNVSMCIADSVSRTVVGSRAAVVDKKSGYEFTGIIPDSILLKNIGLMDNIVEYVNRSHYPSDKYIEVWYYKVIKYNQSSSKI